MPTFDFRCKKCETVFEFARPFGSKTNPSCPRCKSKMTEKLMSPPAIVFKGTGWYKTDSRGPSPAPTATPAPADTKPDAKPEAPAPAKPETTPPAPDAKKPRKKP